MADAVETLETIDFLYRAALEPELWPDALEKLAHAVGGIGTAMIPITPQNITGLIVSPTLQESCVEYRAEWWRHDTRVLRIFSRRLSRGVCCEAELFTDQEVARDPIRQEFLRSYGIGAFAAHLVELWPGFVVAFSVQRALHNGQFEAQELKTLNLLGRHAARALVISTRLVASSGIERTLDSALQQFDCGALVIDRELRVILANDAAQRMTGDGLSIDKGRLCASSREHQGGLASLVASALRKGLDADPAPIALPRPSGRRPLLVQAVPIAAASEEWSMPNSAAALVIVVDPERKDEHNPVAELRLLGLTRSEARLAALIGAGTSRAEAAEALNISESTVSDTMKQIYSKLDMSRQSQLVQLVDHLAVLGSQRDVAERRKPHRLK